MKLKGSFIFLLLVVLSCRVSCVSVADVDELTWSEWGECTRSCGSGIQSRHVVCDEGLDPQMCMYLKIGIPRKQLKQERECNTQQCTGTWSDWTVWQTCSSTCGASAFQIRTRSCNDGNNTPLGSLNCDGLNYEWRPCADLPPCPSNDQSNDLTSHVEHGYVLHSYSSLQSYDKSSQVAERSVESSYGSSY